MASRGFPHDDSTLSDILWVPLGKDAPPPEAPARLLYLPRAARSPAAPPPRCPRRRSRGPRPRPPPWLRVLGAPRGPLPARGPAARAGHPEARGLRRPSGPSRSCSPCGGTRRLSRGTLWRSSEPFCPSSERQGLGALSLKNREQDAGPVSRGTIMTVGWGGGGAWGGSRARALLLVTRGSCSQRSCRQGPPDPRLGATYNSELV